jgi:ABC-2 type transport system permease protein
MREIAIIAQRELRSYFASPIAYVFGVLFLVLVAALTVPEMLKQGQPASMQPFFVYLPILFVVFLPALTMRLWAEERKLGTIELLMTFPVTVRQLVLGKFGASLAYLALVLALTLGLPLTLAHYGRLDWGPVLGAYVGTMLLASAYVAVGMLCSSVTRDQIVAMLLAAVILAALLLLGTPWVQVRMSEHLPAMAVDVLAGLSPYPYFASVSRGVFDSRDFAYYVSFCAFFLYANVLVLNGRRIKG